MAEEGAVPVAKITAVVFALLFGLGVPQALADDAPGDTASGTAGDFRTSPIAAIDARSEVIAENLAEYESQVKNYTLPGGDGTILIYREGGELRKMTVLTDGDGASSSDEYYFWDQDLILIVSVWESFPLWPEQLTSESLQVARSILGMNSSDRDSSACFEMPRTTCNFLKRISKIFTITWSRVLRTKTGGYLMPKEPLRISPRMFSSF
jgi:hypothetical protein